jgi:hypothetical protein
MLRVVGNKGVRSGMDRELLMIELYRAFAFENIDVVREIVRMIFRTTSMFSRVKAR